MPVTIRKATTEDAATIQRLAEAIWWPTYKPILTEGQIYYMLDIFYSITNIHKQITEGLQQYVLLEDEGVAKAFAAYSPRPENPDVYKLHKIYCLPETQGKGYGKLLLQYIEQEVKHAGKTLLELNVNRYNKAKGFYEKNGFTEVYEENIDIGNGYFMDDYVMRKDLNG